jgi:competence protein ComEC
MGIHWGLKDPSFSWKIPGFLMMLGMGIPFLVHGLGWPFSLLFAGLSLGALGLGMGVAHYRWQETVPPPLLSALGPVSLSGQVAHVDYTHKLARVTLKQVRGLSEEDTGLLKKSSVRHIWIFIPTSSFLPGLLPQTTLHLNNISLIPLPFSKESTLYFKSAFQGVNAQASAPLPWSAVHIPSQGEATGLFSWIASKRLQITTFFHHHIPGQGGALAAALITGDKSRLSPQVIQSFFGSGLSHLLAISGLHLSLVSGLFFIWLRCFLSLIPFLALRYPLKEITAVGAAALSFIYLILSGGEAPAQRAFFLILLSFLAILTQRRSTPLYSLGLAAFLMLLYEPENLWSPGFQLSFAAVLGLMRGLERKNPRDEEEAPPSLLQKIGKAFYIPFQTCLISTLMTLPFILKIFGSLPLYAVLANLVGVPLLSCAIMPSLLLMGVGWPLWKILNLSSFWCVLVDGLLIFLQTWAQKVASWPGAILCIPCPPLETLFLWGGSGFFWGLSPPEDPQKKGRNPKFWILMCLTLGGAGVWIYDSSPSRLIWEETDPYSGQTLRGYVNKDHTLVVSHLGHPEDSKGRTLKGVEILMRKTGTTRAIRGVVP